MNDDAIREQAMERLLTAELAEVVANERPRALATWRPLYAALLLLGVFVAAGVAWLANDDRAALQEPKFDAVDPWYEREWPWRGLFSKMLKPGRAAEAPAGVDEFVVTLREADSSDLAEVLDRPAVRKLALTWRNDQAAPDVDPELWQRIARRPELEVLQLAGLAMPPGRLRELRLAPALRYVMLIEGTSPLGDRAAQALAELPRLRAIALGAAEVDAEGLAALAGVPDLEFLLLSPRRADVRALFDTLRKLRNLRALAFECSATVDATALEPLSAMKHLRALDLSHVKLDDQALAALPPQLELLALPSLDGCTPEGLTTLRRLTSLRTLRLRSALSPPMRSVLAAVLGDLALERFDSLTSTPDAATWKALQALPKLRWLTFRRQGGTFEDVVAGCRACEHLEVLTLYEKSPPTPEQLAPLRDHPTLRRIEFHENDVTGIPGNISEERLAALRASVRAQIETIAR
ncbi:MAG TPA: hypothetical protein VF384_12595 [Planctomycetota bacterium]